MKWNDAFVQAVCGRPESEGRSSPFRGFSLLMGAQRPPFYAKVLWELFTTFVIYDTSTNLLRTSLAAANRKWPRWNDSQRQAVLSFLRKLDKKGEVRKEFEYDLPDRGDGFSLAAWILAGLVAVAAVVVVLKFFLSG